MPPLGHQLVVLPFAQTLVEQEAAEQLTALASTALYVAIALGVVSALLGLITVVGMWTTFRKDRRLECLTLFTIWSCYSRLPTTAVVVAPAVLPHGQRGLHDYGLPGGCQKFRAWPRFRIGWRSCLLSSIRFGSGSSQFQDGSVTGLVGENAVSEDGGTEDLAGSASNNGGFEENGEEADLQRKFLIFHATPAWLVSTLVHVIILLILGLVTIADPTQIVNVLSASSTSDDGPEMEEFAIDQIDDSDLSEVEEDTEPVDVSEEMELTETVEVEPMEVATVDLDVADLQSDMAPSAASLQTLASMTAQPMGVYYRRKNAA